MGKTRKVTVLTNNVTGKDDLRRKLPPRGSRNSSRKDDILPSSKILNDHSLEKGFHKTLQNRTKRLLEGGEDDSQTKAPKQFKYSPIVYDLSSTVESYNSPMASCEKWKEENQHDPQKEMCPQTSAQKTQAEQQTKSKACKQFEYKPIVYDLPSTVESYNSLTPSCEKWKEENQHDPQKEMCPQTSAQKIQDEQEIVQPMGYKYIEKLCEEDENPYETAAKLTTERTFQRFEALLAKKDIRHDLMKLIVSLLEIVCRSRVGSHLNKVLGIIQKTNFWNTLAKFVDELYSTKEASNDPSLPTLITNLCNIFDICLERLPDLFSTIPIPQLKGTVERFKNNGKLIDSKIEQLLDELNIKHLQTMKENRKKVSSQDKPPNDFRTLSVFPSREDIFCMEKPFLRENLVDTPYPNVDHYLDVQFRLLKEDSLAGLRNSIRDLKRQDKMKELQSNSRSKPNNDGPKYDVKVYHNVKINNIVTSRDCTNGIVYNVSFDSSHSAIKHTNWERSNRLKYGSLVCVISEDFKTLYFATVQNRHFKELNEGNIQLCFEGREFPRDGAEESYRMVESSSAYFVVYRHILKRLQAITVETMPFKDYIIACNQEIKQPVYLKKKDDKGNPKMIDFTSIVDKSRMENEVGQNNLDSLKKVNPDDLSTWPDASVLGLNESQYKAFQSALRKELVVIQGPPGTGKTFLGLKIAHVLLANSHLWQDSEGESCPILMLSFTNHALDQFLEGLTIDIRGIVRVGGRSSSDSLKNQNLSVLRRGTTQSTKRRSQMDQDLRCCEEELHSYRNTHSQSFEGILFLDKLSGVMNPHHFDQLNSEEDGVLKFLNITLKSSSKYECMMSAIDQDDDIFEFESEDNEGHFSAGRFADSKEDKDDTQSKYKRVVYFADETEDAKKIRANLKQMSDNQVVQAIYIEESNPTNLWRLWGEERWLLYRLWLAKLRENLNRQIEPLQEKHLKLSVNREELRSIEDLNILKRARVVGMTTTWASKNHKLLHQLRPRVMIIEEAAEILEGHVVSSLTQSCQHLILIGDHKQLRPNPSVYQSVKYNLDVSLFERMIKSGVPHNQLGVQHRMRPEISQIVRHIYSDLEDHPSVNEYKNVKGISKNLFFVDHSFHEEISTNTHSKTNVHEARFLVALCHYLLRQGYDSSQITILATYKGQMSTILEYMETELELCPSSGTRLPRVSSVDNYQGDENDIVLLSLVRSNEEENIGFLKTNNRVCVALSRAKKGLYIIGNREILAKKSPLWKAILDDLHKNGCVGKDLTLVCQSHGKENHVSSDKEFQEKVPNGGCLELCKHRLTCGHACPQMCHPGDHQSYQCKKLCQKNVVGCLLGHKCTNECYQPCDNDCKYLVEKQLSCGHSRKLPCSDNENFAKCEEQCEKILCCGHRCQSKCSAPCTKKCFEMVKKTGWSCGHDNTVPCSSTPKDCTVPCGAELECGHSCPGKCGQCIQGRVHVKCEKKCERTLICSHLCKTLCTENCPPCKETCLRKCDHSKCKMPCGEICIPCKEPCEWDCEHFKCTKLCSEICDRARCNEPCTRELQCGKRSKAHHFCRGLCGERCICVICHKNNQTEAITEILFGTEDEEDARFIRLNDCEHIFEVKSLDKHMDSNDGSNEIKIQLCPLCKRPIEKTKRYGNIVKKIHQDIDNVKRKILADAVDFDSRKILLKNRLMFDIAVPLNTPRYAPCKNQRLKKMINFLDKSTEVNYREVVLMESQVRLLKNYLQVKKKYKESTNVTENAEQYRKSPDHIKFNDEMENISDRIMVEPLYMNARILIDLRLELDRMSLKRDVLVLQTKLTNIGVSLKKEDEESVKVLIQTLKDKARIEEEVIEQLKQQIADIYHKHPQLTPITHDEKVQIVQAIGLKQGHWFKCPQGHFYAIGECGGAMERSRCPECNAVIGGQNHRLEENNEIATEMDGAQHAAWSEQANLRNYEMEL